MMVIDSINFIDSLSNIVTLLPEDPTIENANGNQGKKKDLLSR